MSSQNVQEHEVTLVNPSSISSSSSIIPITKDNRRNVTNTLQKELDMRLTAYLPAVVRRYLEKDVNQRVPDTHQITTVSMFVDVSGFTSMTESLAARGPVGAEYLGKHLNSYFQQLLRLVAGAGGDVFKFAGDAMLIFWPEYKEDTLESLLRRSIQCALRIQEHLHKAQLAPEVILSVKMGIGLGGATIAHLGGVHDGATSRMEYIAVGPALEQAFNAEHEAQPGDVICSSECWEMIHQYFEATAIEKGFWKVKQVKLAIKLCSRRPSFTRDDLQLYHRMKQYVSRAVWPYIDIHDEFWGSELRDVTVLFINLGFSEEELAKMLDARGLQRLQDAFEQVQKCIYDYEGTINKFLVDDKGSTVIAAFGLSPVTHENDAIRGILSSLAICAALGKIGLKASVGITTGTTFCGVVGHQGNRREYTVLGDIVNLSARLMQKAKLEKGGVITDERTKILSQDVLHFEERPQIMVKGKNDSIKIHRPYPRMSILMQYHLKQGTTMFPAGPNARMVKGIIISPTNSNSISNSNSTATTTTTTTPLANVMENMHQVQIKEAQRKLSLKSDFQLTNPDDLVHTEPFKKVQEKLIEKCCQVNRFSPGGAFILEGDIGVGKTIGLKSTLHPKSSWVLKEGYQILNTSASPFAGRKSYAVWADILTKAALETYERSSSTSSSSTTSPASSMPVVVSNLHLPSDKFSDNTSVGFVSPPTITVDGSIACNFQQIEEKRRHISSFIKKKIEEGAAPNTKLVKYCYLLNEILETNYEKPNKSKSMDSSTTNSTDSLQSTSRNILVQQKTEEQKSERMHLYRRRRTATTCVFESEDQPESEEMERRNDDNNAEEEEPEEQTHEEQEEQDEYRSGPYTALGAGGRRRSSNFSVKEEEIAAWFLGLLEMDLSDQQEKGQQQGEEDEENSDVDDDDYDDDDDPEEDDHENEMDQEVAEEQEQEAQRRHRSKRAGRRRSTQSIEDKTSRPTTTDDDEQEIEEVWHPKALDLEGILLLCSLHALSRQKTTIFMLDNAMYMDEKSWVIATIISKYFTNCLLVLGTRPPSKAPGGGLEHTESSSFRKQLKMLKKIPNTCNFYMEPLCLNDLELLTKHILKIYEIPNDLLSILFARSQGNPFFLKEILKEMIEQQVISVDEKLRMVKMQVQTAWDDKTYAIYCFRCAIKFLTSKDKHRCRACGYVFCQTCTPKACYKKLLTSSSNEAVRHCCSCYSMSTTRRPSSDVSTSSMTMMAAMHGGNTGIASSSINMNTRHMSLAGANSALATAVTGRQRSRSRMRSFFQSDFIPQQYLGNNGTGSNNGCTISQLKTRLLLRPPPVLKSVLATLLDQLSLSQRMIMKTASVIGPVFEEELLRHSCPIKDHLDQFDKDLLELQSMSMIRRVEHFIGGLTTPSASAMKSGSWNGFNRNKQQQTRTTSGLATKLPPGHNRSTSVILSGGQISSTSKAPSTRAYPSAVPGITEVALKRKYEFAYGFLEDVVRGQLLSSQVDKLHQRITEVKEQQEKILRQKFFEKAKESLLHPGKSPLLQHSQTLPLPHTQESRACIPTMTLNPPVLLASPSDSSKNTGGPLSTTTVTTSSLSATRSKQISPPMISTTLKIETSTEAGLTGPSCRTSIDLSYLALALGESANLKSLTSFEQKSSVDSIRSREPNEENTSTISPNKLAKSPVLMELMQAAQMATFARLKVGSVLVKKQSSVFAHVKGLRHTRSMWKRRFAVLQSNRLLLHYTEDSAEKTVGGSGTSTTGTSTTSSDSSHAHHTLWSGRLPEKPRRATSLFLKGAKVSVCDPEVTSKMNCFQIEVNEYTKGKYLINQKRFFIIDVENELEVEHWIYMIKYAIESLENNSE